MEPKSGKNLPPTEDSKHLTRQYRALKLLWSSQPPSETRSVLPGPSTGSITADAQSRHVRTTLASNLSSLWSCCSLAPTLLSSPSIFLPAVIPLPTTPSPCPLSSPAPETSFPLLNSLRVTRRGFGVRGSGSAQYPLFSGCMTLGKLTDLSKPEMSHPSNRVYPWK